MITISYSAFDSTVVVVEYQTEQYTGSACIQTPGTTHHRPGSAACV